MSDLGLRNPLEPTQEERLMGYIAHHAIIVEGYNEPFASGDWPLKAAHDKARELFGERVTEITPQGVNGSAAFLVPPDGSKEGWTTSDEGDEARDAFVSFLGGDLARGLDWVEVRFGGDEPSLARIVRFQS